MNFRIYIPFVNQIDSLLRAIDSIDGYQDHIVIIDNSPDQHLDIANFTGEICRPPVPLFCSQSYNLIKACAEQQEEHVFFIMHSDAEASNDIIKELLTKADELNREQIKWGVIFTNYDVLCLHNTSTLKCFRWDSNLPIYYTDVDFYRRLRLAGIELIATGLPVKHMNGGSSSMKADPALYQFIQCSYPGWAEYYRRKWGGPRDQETFTVPFNQTADLCAHQQEPPSSLATGHQIIIEFLPRVQADPTTRGS